MKCVLCNSSHSLKKEYKNNFKYKDCGLDNVTLSRVTYFRCKECGEEYFNFGDVDKLHSLIAGILVTMKKGILSGEEVRFLRSFLGYSGEMFSKLVGCTPESLSRIEHNKQQIGKPLERLIRTLVVNKLPDRNYDLHEILLKNCSETYKRIHACPVYFRTAALPADQEDSGLHEAVRPKAS